VLLYIHLLTVPYLSKKHLVFYNRNRSVIHVSDFLLSCFKNYYYFYVFLSEIISPRYYRNEFFAVAFMITISGRISHQSGFFLSLVKRDLDLIYMKNLFKYYFFNFIWILITAYINDLVIQYKMRKGNFLWIKYIHIFIILL